MLADEASKPRSVEPTRPIADSRQAPWGASDVQVPAHPLGYSIDTPGRPSHSVLEMLAGALNQGSLGG